jgi:hypothetical protein
MALNTGMLNVNYAKCHYAKCRYAECRGATGTTTSPTQIGWSFIFQMLDLARNA